MGDDDRSSYRIVESRAERLTFRLGLGWLLTRLVALLLLFSALGVAAVYDWLIH